MKQQLLIDQYLHKGQVEVFQNLKRFTIIVAGRRWGKTRLCAFILLVKALTIPKSKYWWISPTYKISDIGYEFFKKIIAKTPHVIKEADRKIILFNGSEIEFKSADTPDNLRGKGLSGVVFDEAAYIQEDVWIGIIRPTITINKGWAIFISTPNGKNWFYRLVLDAEGKEDWIVFHKPTSDNHYVPREELLDTEQSTPAIKFRQEYLAEFLDDSSSVFRNLTKQAVAPRDTTHNQHKGHSISIGVDLAKSDDFTVITGICETCKKQVFIDRSNNVDYLFQVKRLVANAERWKPESIVVETNNVGVMFIEALTREGLSIVEFTTTAQSKPDLIENLSVAIEMGELEILNDPIQLNELGAFGFEVNKLGRRSYSAPKGLHDDTVMGLALAYYGIKHKATHFVRFL